MGGEREGERAHLSKRHYMSCMIVVILLTTFVGNWNNRHETTFTASSLQKCCRSYIVAAVIVRQCREARNLLWAADHCQQTLLD